MLSMYHVDRCSSRHQHWVSTIPGKAVVQGNLPTTETCSSRGGFNCATCCMTTAPWSCSSATGSSKAECGTLSNIPERLVTGHKAARSSFLENTESDKAKKSDFVEVSETGCFQGVGVKADCKCPLCKMEHEICC